MLINIESIAEDYCSAFSDYELSSIKDDGVDLDSLRDWMESELRSTIEIVISDQCSILEDYEIASILADYVQDIYKQVYEKIYYYL